MATLSHVTILHKLSKNGKVQEYHLGINTGGICPILITEKGFTGGAFQTDEKEFWEGKNIGRANETTALGQALSELESKVKKLLDKGYKKVEEGVNIEKYLQSTDGTDATGNLKPMLAQKDLRKIVFPGFAQRKFDGVRCFTLINPDKISKASRNGKPFIHLDHLDRDLKSLLGELSELGHGNEWIIDGELYSHNLSFQNIISSIKREQPSNEEIEYRIYDIIPTSDLRLPQLVRMNIIEGFRKDLETYGVFKHLEFTKTTKVKDMEKLKRLFAKYIEEGYEGLMFRSYYGEYEFGRRSYSLIKYKVFDEEEFEIIGTEEATGRDEGTAVFVLQTDDDKVFRARPMGTREERRDYLLKTDELVGEWATVKFQGYSDTGIPRFPTLKSIRDYE